MSEICKLFRIVMDTSDGDFINVYINDNKLINLTDAEQECIVVTRMKRNV